MNTHRWINLPGLSRWEKTFLLLPLNISCRGRRGHTMTTIEGKLAVMGGAAKINGKESLLKDPSCSICETRIESHWSVFFCGPGGDTEYLDDVEIFDGRRWKRANYKLDQVKERKVFLVILKWCFSSLIFDIRHFWWFSNRISAKRWSKYCQDPNHYLQLQLWKVVDDKIKI